MTTEKPRLSLDVKEAFDLRREYLDARLSDMSSRIMAIETQVSNGFEKVDQRLRIAVADVEVRIKEKIEDRDKAFSKRDEAYELRLSQIGKFRDEMTEERSTYVTRDRLDSELKSTYDQFDILKRAVTMSAGKGQGISLVWFIIVTGFSIMSVIISIFTSFRSLLIH